MATYQFYTRAYPSSPKTWRDISSQSLIKDIDNIIERASWTDFTSWKIENGKVDHDVALDVDDNGEIEEFAFRVDLRDDTKMFLKNILSICHKYDLQLITIDSDSFNPTIEDYLLTVKASTAHIFVANPDKFFDTT